MLKLDECVSNRENKLTAKHLRLLKKKMVRPLLKHARECAQTAGHMRRAADGEVIDRLPKPQTVHQAALDAMADLYTFYTSHSRKCHNTHLAR